MVDVGVVLVSCFREFVGKYISVRTSGFLVLIASRPTNVLQLPHHPFPLVTPIYQSSHLPPLLQHPPTWAPTP